MKNRRQKYGAGWVRSFAFVLLVPGMAAAEEIWAVTAFSNLIRFESTNPWVFSSRPITGMAPGEQALGIDFRPAVPLGRLYVLASTGRIYRIDDPTSGAAVPVGVGPLLLLQGSEFGMDFNPTVDRIRVVSDANQNIRIHPDTGALAATDSSLAFAVADPNAGQDPTATGAAYTNNVPMAASTVLYDIDTGLDLLVTQIPPNNGRLNTIGPLGIDATAVNGFDISGTSGVAYAALGTGTMQSTLYTIALASGTATSLGVIGCQEPIRGLSVSNDANVGVEAKSWSGVKALYGR